MRKEKGEKLFFRGDFFGILVGIFCRRAKNKGMVIANLPFTETKDLSCVQAGRNTVVLLDSGKQGSAGRREMTL